MSFCRASAVLLDMTLLQADSDNTHVLLPVTNIGIAHVMRIPHYIYVPYLYPIRLSKSKLSAAIACQYVSTIINRRFVQRLTQLQPLSFEHPQRIVLYIGGCYHRLGVMCQQ